MEKEEAETLFEQMAQNEKETKIKRFKHLNRFIQKGQVLFVGSSLMEQFPIHELLQDYNINKIIYNRGVGGYTTIEMAKVMDTLVYDVMPSKIFINIGTNDINLPDFTVESLILRYENILKEIRQKLPDAKIYVMAYYPVNETDDFGNEFMKAALKVRTNTVINKVNDQVKLMAERLSHTYIDVNKNLKDETGNLKKEYTIEGMHMFAEGYRAIFDDLMEYVNEEV